MKLKIRGILITFIFIIISLTFYTTDNLGHMTREHKIHIKQNKHVHIPSPIIKHHKQVEMHIDHCFINGRPFYRMIPDKINLRTIKPCKSRGKKKILNSIKTVEHKYTHNLFEMYDYYVLKKLWKFEQYLAPAVVHIHASVQHSDKS